jgi:glycosyltransferase involved in cell wall biosynthesis
MTRANHRITVFLYRMRFGGAERVMLTLSEEFARRGLKTDLVACEAKGEFSAKTPDGVRLFDLNATSPFRAAQNFSRYISERNPSAVIANGDRCVLSAFAARAFGCVKPRLVGVIHHDLAGILDLHDAPLKDRFLARAKKAPMPYVYRRADKIVAVSRGTAEGSAKFLGVPRDKITVIYNPIPTNEIRLKALEPADHPWFSDGGPPIIISCGRLAPQKDFPTLVRAFALVRRKTAARLVIIGDGPEREKIEGVIRSLGLDRDASLLGYQENPFKFVAKSRLFAVSSVFEGLSMVILEALALGVPAVSTDCPSGPRELLAGHPERLAPVGDAATLAEVMLAGLEIGREDFDMSPYTLERCADGYLDLLDD